MALTEELVEPPDFGEKGPPAKGIILAFKHWPLSKEESKAILKKANALELSKINEYSIFKSYVFEWAEWKNAEQAIRACEGFADFSNILDYCEPDFLLSPATGLLRKKAKKNLHKERERRGFGPDTEPTPGVKLAPPPVSSGSGNIVSCNIVPTQLKLKGGALSDYWAQEMVGADLMKERLKKAPSMKKHLVAVFDSPYSYRHDIATKNIISGKGRQATLPDIGKSMTVFDSSLPSYNMDNSHYLNRVANEKCADKKKQKEKTSFSSTNS